MKLEEVCNEIIPQKKEEMGIALFYQITTVQKVLLLQIYLSEVI
jgi:hypothetical protein